MPDDRMTLTDWLSAQARLAQGRTSDPSQDKLYAADTPAWWWPQQAYRERQTPGLIPRPDDVEALPLGSLSDPVSQAAFLMAPGVLRAGKAGADALAQPGYARGFGQGGRLTMLSSQRGNLGPVPRSEYGEALPRSVVRGADGKLTKLYHGAKRPFPDFDISYADPESLYGPGIYMTDSAEAEAEYALTRGLGGGDRFGSGGASPAASSRPVYADLKTVLPLDAPITPTLKQAVQRLNPDFTGDTNQAAYEALTQGYASRAGEALRQWRAAFPTPRAFRQAVQAANGRFDAAVPAEVLDVPLPQLGLSVRQYLAQVQQASETGTLVAGGATDLYNTVNGLAAEAIGKTATRAYLQQQGYDGLSHTERMLDGVTRHRVYIAFSPEHVYPAPNVEALP